MIIAYINVANSHVQGHMGYVNVHCTLFNNALYRSHRDMAGKIVALNVSTNNVEKIYKMQIA